MADTIKIGLWVLIAVLGLVVIVGATTIYLTSLSTGIQHYVFFGTDDIALAINQQTVSGELGAIITALMIWLLIFVAFGDIFENFSAFSSGIAWVIAFAIAVVAANVGFINITMVKLIGVFAWLGTFAIFASLAAALLAFFAVNWGMASLLQWLKNRHLMMKASTGRTYAAEGLKTLTKTGKIISQD